MTVPTHKVVFGYFPNFKGGHVLLFTGDRQALENFASYLEGLAKAPGNVTTMLDREPLFVPKQGTRLTLTISDSQLGMHRIAPDRSRPSFDWRISRSLAAKFATLTRGVALMDEPSHQYLDADGDDDLTVMVSKGEYDDPWLQRQK